LGTRNLPSRLHHFILKDDDHSDPKIFSKSDHQIGKQVTENQVGDLLNDICFDWKDGLTDAAI